MTALIPIAIAALIAAAAPALDTVFLRNGGRVRGTVVEEDPSRGISIQLPNGEFRKLLPAEIARVEYGQPSGSAVEAGPESVKPAPPQPAAAPAEPSASSSGPTNDSPPPPPEATLPPAGAPPTPAPAPSAEPVPAGTEPYPPPVAVTVAMSLFSMSPGGDAEGGKAMKDFTSAMGGFGLEAGLRLDERLTLGAYFDFASGVTGATLEDWCVASGLECTTADMKLGLLARWAFTPSDWQTPWIALGAGVDVMVAVPDDPKAKTPSYVGFEPLRLSVGWDYRGWSPFGIGVFATASWSRYASVDDGTGTVFAIEDRRGHSWLQIGVRGILFP
jgi:hypothetical protein